MMHPNHPQYANPDYEPSHFIGWEPISLRECKGCGNGTSHPRGYCTACRQNCALCDDWLMGEPEMLSVKGERVHVICEATAVLETLPSFAVRR